MDVTTTFDPLAEPLTCPHGKQFLALPDGSMEWLTPCRACETNTVAVPRQDAFTRLSA